MTHTTAPAWEAKRTDETRAVETRPEGRGVPRGRRVPLQLGIDPRPRDR